MFQYTRLFDPVVSHALPRETVLTFAEAVLTQLQGRESESQACCERRAGCLATAASTALSV